MKKLPIAARVADNDLLPCILTTLLRLAHEEDREDLRTSAASLANKLSARLGEELCRQFIIPEIISLSEDPVSRLSALTPSWISTSASPTSAARRS